MIITEDLINSILREIDVLYSEGNIKADEADDLTNSVTWLIGKSLNESNISFTINTLRGYKKYMNENSVTKIINSIRKTLGSAMQ